MITKEKLLLHYPNLLNSRGGINANLIKKSSSEIIELIKDDVALLSIQNYNLSEQLKIIINKIPIDNKCEICGKETSFDGVKFRTFCSLKCSRDEKSSKYEKAKQTNLERYGKPHTFEVTKEKRKQTCLERYGGHHAKSEKVRKKTKETNLKKYGVDNPAKSLEVKEKIREAHQKLFDGHYAQRNFSNDLKQKLTSKEFCQKICEDRTKTFSVHAKELGITTKTLISYIRKFPELVVTRKPVSELESMVADHISSVGISFETNNRNMILKELDLWIPEHKLAIELNGIYWHSDLLNKNNKYSAADKFQLCQEKDITLLTFFENEIHDNFELIKSVINHKLGISSRIIYARNCDLKKISHQQKSDFYNENHLMGDLVSHRNYGLFLGSELVAAISFIKNRSSIESDYELARFACLKNTSVVGGFSKLLKFGIQTNDIESLMTFANLRFGSSSNVYMKNGFSYDGITKPGYFYARQNKGFFERKSRQQAVKSRSIKFLEHFDPTKSQYENMTDNGWKRLWDCGHSIHRWRKGC